MCGVVCAGAVDAYVVDTVYGGATGVDVGDGGVGVVGVCGW